MDTLLEKVRLRALGTDAHEASGVRLRQRGEIRLAPGRSWLPFEAEQHIRADVPAFRWTARVRMAPLLNVAVVDAYEDGRGRLDARLWRVLPLARGRGPTIDRGELLRYLAELPWCPLAYVGNPWLRLQAEDATHLRVGATDSTGDVSVRLTVGPEGDVLNAYTADRPRTVGTTCVATPWRGTFSDHRLLGGLRIPWHAVVAWELDDGPFECFRGEVTDLRCVRGAGAAAREGRR